MTTVATQGSPCPYCQAPVELRPSSAFIYNGRDYGAVYVCTRYPTCDAFVGCHSGTTKALGRLADSTLRYWKKRAHAAIDPLWQHRWRTQNCIKAAARGAAYSFLSQKMGLPPAETHIGMFDVPLCQQVVEICAPYCRMIDAGQDPGEWK